MLFTPCSYSSGLACRRPMTFIAEEVGSMLSVEETQVGIEDKLAHSCLCVLKTDSVVYKKA